MSTNQRRILIFSIDHPTEGAFVFASEPVGFLVSGVAPAVRISGANDIVIERAVTCWPFGGSAQNKRGTIAVLNGDRALDALVSVAWRDAPFRMRWCWQGEAYKTGFDEDDLRTWQSGVIDGFSTEGNTRRLVFSLADPLAILDKPLQGDTYPALGYANASAASRNKPIALGVSRFVPGVLRSTAITGADAYSFDLHDAPIAHITDAYDRGDAYAAGDWEYVQPNRTGVRLVSLPNTPIAPAPLNPVCFNLAGAVVEDFSTTPGDSVVLAQDFRTVGGSWTTAPSGWSKSGTFTCTQVTNGCQISSVLGTPYLQRALAFSSRQSYLVEIDVASVTAGSFHPQNNAAAASMIPAAQRCGIAGVHRFVFANDGYTNLRIYFAAGSNLTIRSIRVAPVSLTDTPAPLLQWVVRKAIGLSQADTVALLDVAAMENLHSDTGYQLGGWINGADAGLDVLTRIMDSYCGWFTSKRDGTYTVGRLHPREGADATLVLDTRNILAIRRRADTAPGLTTRLAGARNYCVHSDSDIALSVGEADRAALKSEYVIKEAASRAALPTAYNHAQSAAPRPTWLQIDTDIEAEATRVIDLFGLGQFTWFDIDASLPAEVGDSIEMGDWIHIRDASAGLDEGAWVVCFGATIRFHARRVTLAVAHIPDGGGVKDGKALLERLAAKL